MRVGVEGEGSCEGEWWAGGASRIGEGKGRKRIQSDVCPY